MVSLLGSVSVSVQCSAVVELAGEGSALYLPVKQTKLQVAITSPPLCRCVTGPRMKCSNAVPHANCKPLCQEKDDNKKCNCKNPLFPDNWC